MKIYQAIKNPYSDANQYVMTLMEGIDGKHNDVEWGWGVDKFWQDDIFNYDIIHIQWPISLLWYDKTPREIEYRLSKLKECGKKIVSTCHNLEPHYCSDINVEESYSIVYRESDMILHLGTYSLNFMRESLPNVKHVLLPHHIYDTIYDTMPNRDDACRKMRLNPKYKYVICFGAFRDEEERIIVRKLADKLKSKGVFFIAPAYRSILARNFFGRIFRKCEKLRQHYFNHIIMTGDSINPVSVAMTPYYYAVADVALIQRKKILNSGNLSLAFWMKKVVVGPNVGNVGIWLKKTGNPSFDVNDDTSICNALIDGFNLAKENYGEKNYQYALDNFSTSIISEKLYNYYKSIIND